MVTLPTCPAGVTNAEPTSSYTALEVVRWTDAADARLWIAALRSATEDATAAGKDAEKPKRAGVLPRAEVARKRAAAEETITRLLDGGERCLPPLGAP